MMLGKMKQMMQEMKWALEQKKVNIGSSAMEPALVNSSNEE